MRILFVNNQIDNRGTGNALFDYALYNESILGNESMIMSLNMNPANPLMEKRIKEWFGDVYSPYDIISSQTLLNSIDLIYHIKSGENDGSLHVSGIPLAVHAVFNPTQPHGDRYATISHWMGEQFRVPYVPHIVNKKEYGFENLEYRAKEYRRSLGIPPNAFVFARYGGPDTFDIPWAWDALIEVSRRRKSIYFLFAGTNRPKDEDMGCQFIFLPEIIGDMDRRLFVASSDAMIHARMRGETYGMSVGEFAVQDKPVLSYADSPERAHLEMLDSPYFEYHNKEELIYLIENFQHGMIGLRTEYHEHTPENVMRKFREVFL